MNELIDRDSAVKLSPRRQILANSTSSRNEGVSNYKYMAHNLARKAPGKDSLCLKRKAAPGDGEFLASLTAA
ncbi:MAG: hypothetical protein WBE80_11500 [Methylocella sp.]